ncbi:PIN domain-containing protein [Candidatus Babeliales bacterium]|nr:PIN domain-containing protein [Candidatus Babeliales bacterium]
MSNIAVIYDACILYSAPLRDLFMRLALTDLYRAKWSEDIHQEWIRNLLKNRPDLTREQLEKIKQKMDTHVRDCLVVGYNNLIEKVKLPDPNDRHVLAAAIQVKAQIIVTFNLSDFPLSITKKYKIEAQHPDKFLKYCLDIAPSIVLQTVKETRLSLKNPPKSISEYLKILEKQSLNQTVLFLRDYSDYL